MKAKKAEITLENTLTVILAALGLILLFAGAYKLYQIISNQEQENAKNFINVLEAKINSLQDGETNIFSIRGVESKDGSQPWFLTGWSKDDPDRLVDKIECFLDSCICVCKGNSNSLVGTCKKGFCKKINKDKVKIEKFIPEETRPSQGSWYVDPNSGIIPSRIEKFITLPQNLIALQINKTSSEIIISKNE